MMWNRNKLWVDVVSQMYTGIRENGFSMTKAHALSTQPWFLRIDQYGRVFTKRQAYGDD